MNQLLRLYTAIKIHTQKKKYMLKKKKTKRKNNEKKNSTNLPPQEKKDSYNTPNGGHHGNSQGTGAVTVVARTFTPEVVAILDFLHFYVSAT